MKLPRFLRMLFRGDSLEREMSEEMRFHLDMLVDEKVRRGIPPDAARLEALREFGGIEQHKERSRDERGGRWLADFVQDFQIGLRRSRREWRFVGLCVLVLALGVGSTTVMFSVVDAVLVRPLPINDADRVMRLWEANAARGISRFSVAHANYIDWAARSHCWDTLDALDNRTSNIMVQGEPERVRAGLATPGSLSLFGWQVLKGRGLLPIDNQPGQAPVALLSESMWRNRFGGDPEIEKRPLLVDGVPHAIVGILAAGEGLDLGLDLVMPIRSSVSPDRDDKDIEVYGRLKSSVSLAQAREEMAAVAQNLAREYPSDNGGWSITLEPLFDTIVQGRTRGMVHLMSAASLLLLFIACANLSGLLLVAATKRTQELSVRAALGGSRGRLIRQVLAETTHVTGLGGMLGAMLAWWGVDAVRAAQSLNLPRADLIALDWRALGFALVSSITTGLIASIVPAILVSRVNVQHGLRGTGSLSALTRGRARNLLVASQLALTIVLLAAAGMLVRSVIELHRAELGFRPERVVTARLMPGNDQAKFVVESLIERVSAFPNVVAVGAVSSAPMAAYNTTNHVFPVGGAVLPSTHSVQSEWRIVTADYFRAMEITVLKGRTFSPSDNAAGPRVVIVNEALARALWGDADPIGRQINPGGGHTFSTVIGIVRDIRNRAPGELPAPAYYLSAHRGIWGAMTLVVRSNGGTTEIVPRLRAELRALAPTVPLFDVQELSALVDRQIAPQAALAWLLSVFAMLALVLAAVGLYGVMAYATAQRSREVGIRMALGAGKWDVLRPLLREGGWMVAGGAAAGLAMGLLLTRVLRAALELPSTASLLDGAVVLSASLALGVVAMVACYVPVRRALRVDPLIALRTE